MTSNQLLLQGLCATSRLVKPVLLILIFQIWFDAVQCIIQFNPTVTAACRHFPYMTVMVDTHQPFNGVVYVRDQRKPSCMVNGTGGNTVTLRLNTLAKPTDDDYCGVVYNERSGDRSAAVDVRVHRTLELLEDKVFVISCGQPGYTNFAGDLSRLSLTIYDDGSPTLETVNGRQYTARVTESNSDGRHTLKVRSCYAYSANGGNRVELTDDKGCSASDFMSRFKRVDSSNSATESIIYSMFSFPESALTHINCLVSICKGSCPEEPCDGSPGIPSPSGTEEVWVAASVYAVEPRDLRTAALVEDCSNYRLILGLCITFGILFLIMLIVNICLCCALSCVCAKQEVIEREPSVIEDYDPYKSGWASANGSHYGSRYSLNAKPGGSTLNSTARSVGSNSDHYAIVHNQQRENGSAFGHPHHRPASHMSHVSHRY